MNSGEAESVAALQRQIAEMDEDFGKRRAKFKELFMAKESELTVEREKCAALRVELDNTLTRLAVAEVTYENKLDVENRKHAEELASLQHLEKEQASAFLQEYVDRYQTEIQQLREQLRRHQQVQQPSHGRTGSSGGAEESIFSPHVLSAVTKQLAKKITLGTVGGTGSGQPSPQHTQQLATADTDAAAAPPINGAMKRAQEDSEMMRSLVVPLEEEIQALKDKLRSTDAQLQIQLAAREQLLRADQLLSHLRAESQLEQLSEQLRQLVAGRVFEAADAVQSVVRGLIVQSAEDGDCGSSGVAAVDDGDCSHAAASEGDSRCVEQSELLLPSFCLYTSLLEAQKLALKDDVHYSKQMVSDLRAQLAQERAQLAEARLACKNTSDQLLETQRHHLSQTRRLRTALPADLLPLLEESAAAAGTAAASASHALVVSTDSSRQSLNTVDQGDGDSEQQVANHGSSQSLNMADTSSSGGSFRAAVDRTDVLSVQSLNLMPGQRLVSDREWSLLWDELSINKHRTGRCDRCSSLESQLERVQDELRETEKRRGELSRALERHQQELSREAKYRKDTETAWERAAADSEKLVLELSKAVESGEVRCSQLEAQYSRFVSDIQDKLRRLTADRHVIQQELTRLQTENDTVLGKHGVTAAELQNEFINLPSNIEEAHELLLRYKEDLISAKIARELADERLQNQEVLAKNEQRALKREKDVFNNELIQENNTLREQLTVLESIRSELEAEQLRRSAADQQLTALRAECDKHQQVVAELNQQISTLSEAKAALQKEMSFLKGKVSTLQQDMDNSETVQRDFVKLSQSLQMELERIRQAETEVRWQHEEDVDACTRCRSRFSVARRKHHCRHCGKIFCMECLSNIVQSGPSRTGSRVCDVCHTLLNRDSAPYFSSHAPAQPE